MKILNQCNCGCVSEDASQNIGACPICKNKGVVVGAITVEHLLIDNKEKLVEGEQYRICMNEDCDVVYYNVADGIKFLKNQINVPIWFKKDANPKYACYCNKVTEEQVIDAVVNHGAKTVKDVNGITGAMKNANCKVNNPMGKCCHNIIQEIIDKVL